MSFFSTAFESLGLGDHDQGHSIFRFDIFQNSLAENKLNKLSCTDYSKSYCLKPGGRNKGT